MADILDFLPLTVEDVESIRARVDSDVNAGYAPEDDSFIDTAIGGFYYDITQALILEIERLWDYLSVEVPAAAFVTMAWGEYLDEHGAVISVSRRDAIVARGVVTFTGDNGTIIPAGFRVGVEQVDVDLDPVEFRTVSNVTIASGEATVDIRASDAGSLGNVAANAISVLLTPISGVATVSNEDATSGGADVETDEQFRERLLIEYSSRQGSGSIDDYRRWSLELEGIGGVTVTPLWNGAGTVHVIVTDVENQPLTASQRNEVQQFFDPASAETTVNGGPQALGGSLFTVTVATTSGFTDFGYIYINRTQRIKYANKTGTTFTNCTGGSGNALNGQSVMQLGHGLGQAPIGHEVIVDTPTILTVNVVATIDLMDGYSLGASAGDTDIEADILDAIQEHINGLPPGADVLVNRIEAVIINVRGVYNVGTGATPVTLNGTSADLSVTDFQVANLGTITLTEL